MNNAKEITALAVVIAELQDKTKLQQWRIDELVKKLNQTNEYIKQQGGKPLYDDEFEMPF